MLNEIPQQRVVGTKGGMCGHAIGELDAWVQNPRFLLFMTPSLDWAGHAFHANLGKE